MKRSLIIELKFLLGFIKNLKTFFLKTFFKIFLKKNSFPKKEINLKEGKYERIYIPYPKQIINRNFELLLI